MDRPITAFGNSLNWDLLVRITAEATADPLARGGHLPMPPFEVETPARILQIGVSTSRGKPHWDYGGVVSVRSTSRPSSTSQFSGGPEIFKQTLSYGTLKQIQLPFYEPLPIKLFIKAPKYFWDIYLEVWYYSGLDSDETREALIRIEEKIDLL